MSCQSLEFYQQEMLTLVLLSSVDMYNKHSKGNYCSVTWEKGKIKCNLFNTYRTPKSSLGTHSKVTVHSRSNSNLECWFLWIELNLITRRIPSEQRREPTTSLTHIWHQLWEMNPTILVEGECSQHSTIPAPTLQTVHTSLTHFILLFWSLPYCWCKTK